MKCPWLSQWALQCYLEFMLGASPERPHPWLKSTLLRHSKVLLSALLGTSMRAGGEAPNWVLQFKGLCKNWSRVCVPFPWAKTTTPCRSWGSPTPRILCSLWCGCFERPCLITTNYQFLFCYFCRYLHTVWAQCYSLEIHMALIFLFI